MNNEKKITRCKISVPRKFNTLTNFREKSASFAYFQKKIMYLRSQSQMLVLKKKISHEKIPF